MQAARVHHFGGPDAITIDEIDLPGVGGDDILVQIHAAGVGPWDAWVRSGRSVLPQPLPLTLGSDFSGVVIAAGPRAHGFSPGQSVFGVVNKQFTGAYAEYALARAAMIAPKPALLDHLHSASVPVVAVTALQMVADVRSYQRVLVLGAGGNVGAYAVQLARRAGAYVIGADLAVGLAYAGEVGADELLDTASAPLPVVDVVIDTVGGELAERAAAALAPGGWIVSSVQAPHHARSDIRAEFLLVDVTSEALRAIADARLATRLGSVLSLAQARVAHEMLAGRVAHLPGRIVLEVAP